MGQMLAVVCAVGGILLCSTLADAQTLICLLKSTQRFSRMLEFVTALVLSVMLGAPTPLQAQSLTWLGTFGGNQSHAYGVSADGAVVVGWARNASGYYRAFRWTQATGMQDLGTLGGDVGEAYGVSADGAVVVGKAKNANSSWRAFRWTQAGGMQDLGTLGGAWVEAYGVSADGAVVVGWSYDAMGWERAFRWGNGVMQDLGTLGGSKSHAYGVSANGAVVVGWAQNTSGYSRAFRWLNGGMQYIGTLVGGNDSHAYGISADGAVVVGRGYTAGGWHAFRWTAAAGMQDLGTLGGNYSEAYSASADGSVVVGWARNASGYDHAFRWTSAGGMEDLNITYASLLTGSSSLLDARAISPDGRYIVGQGWNATTQRTEAFLLDTAPSLSRIRGNIVLNDFTGDPSQVPVQVELRGNNSQTLTIYPQANGDYTISDVQPGTYDIAFKASHWLRVVVPNVNVSGVEVTGIDVALTNGDVDGDNEVILFDFGALVAAFGSMPGDANWNADADLDGDEEVTLFDFGVLVRNLGAIGDD